MSTAKSLQEMKDRVRVEPDWIIRNFLKRGNTAIIMGQPKKACKSWLVLGMCWDLSEGKPVWEVKGENEFVLVPPRPLRCVYFTQEDTEDDAHDRTLANFNGGRQPNDRLWLVPKNLMMTLDTIAGRKLVQDELDAIRAKAGAIDVVAFDPMRRIHHGDENDSATIAALWGVMDRIHKRYGCSTVITHHTIKPPQDRSSFDPSDPYTGRGSGDIYGGGDAFVVVVPGNGNEQHRKVSAYFESKRGRPQPPAQLKVTYATGKIDFLGAGWPQQQDADTNI